MSLPSKQKLNDAFIEEYAYYTSVVQNPLRTTTGAASYTNPRTLASYSVADGGQNALAIYMFETNPALRNYTFTDSDYTKIKNWSIQYEYQTPTVVGTQIQVLKPSDSAIIKFTLGSPVTGGAITISTDGGATDVALKNGAGEAVTELSAGLIEVAYVSGFFILRSSGGLDSFFGDGSDGTMPNLNTVTSAPNGGNVSNLWDMSAGTVFTTGTLSSASDQVVFSIDFGMPVYISPNLSPISGMRLFSASINTGVARTLSFQYSTDNVVWAETTTQSITTSSADKEFFGLASKYRYWRLVLKSGGSNCALSIQGITLNFNGNADAQTTKVWRILEPSTLNGAAVVKQYTDFNLLAGYEITVQNPNQGLIIYSQNDITNAGVIDMSQKAGLAPNGNAIPMLISKKAYKTAKTSSLLHFDNNITDDNGRVWTNNGAVTFDATNKKFGTHAISLNGTSQWIDTPASDDFSFGSDDFTIDFWMRPTSIASTATIASDTNALGGTSVQFLTQSSKLNVRLFTDASNFISLLGLNTLINNTFYHICVARKDGVNSFYIDGALQSQIVNSLPIVRSNGKFTIGRRGEISSDYFAGQIDEFRIIKGKAMYTSNFTPPTSAYAYQATYIDTPKTLEKYFQLTNVLQTLRGGYGGNGGQSGGYSGTTGAQTSVGIGGAGRQNLGGFGGGGSGGAGYNRIGGIGGSILYSEIGGSLLSTLTLTTSELYLNGINGRSGGGATGGIYAINGGTPTMNGSSENFGGGSGASGGIAISTGSGTSGTGTSGQYAGGFVMLVVKNNITNTGVIRVNGGIGGNGGNASSNTLGAGGGGAGGGSGAGTIAVFYGGNYSNTGTIQANGGASGTGGTGSGTGSSGLVGTSGSVGTIHIQQI